MLDKNKLTRIIPLKADEKMIYDGSIKEIHPVLAGDGTIICNDGFISKRQRVRFLGFIKQELKKAPYHNRLSMRRFYQMQEQKDKYEIKARFIVYTVIPNFRDFTVEVTVSTSDDASSFLKHILNPEEWSFTTDGNGFLIVKFGNTILKKISNGM